MASRSPERRWRSGGRTRADATRIRATRTNDSGALRAPHIHFQVTGRVNRLVTQLYFAGEPLNENDRYLVSAAGNKGRLIVDLQAVPGDPEKALSASWDIVLHDG